MIQFLLSSCLEKEGVLRRAYYKYAREDGDGHIEGKHVPFQRYVITPEER